MPDAVEFIVGDSGTNMAAHLNEGLGCNPPSDSHCLNLISGADRPTRPG